MINFFLKRNHTNNNHQNYKLYERGGLSYEKMDIVRTKSGLPAMWESGGGYTNTGESVIIAGRNGERKKPIYIRKKGHLANREHALYIVNKGDIVVQAYHHREDFTIRVYKIVDFEDNYAILELLYYYEDGEWDKPLPEKYKDVVDAAMHKAIIYHCRYPVYYKEHD
ncbi:MAG: hypothetical protein KatS3mg096_636 [Candidatus Parcubacteria bacterium]|nr:MAG: hypothetical protein KatS3mg096_636 [Candidatus Parcubacteria bacterium]